MTADAAAATVERLARMVVLTVLCHKLALYLALFTGTIFKPISLSERLLGYGAIGRNMPETRAKPRADEPPAPTASIGLDD
jgi:hypothetical protein